MSKKNDLLNKVCSDLSPATKSLYQKTINKYEKCHDMTFEELLDEALEEQDERIPEHKLKIYDRILSFREYNLQTMLGSSVQNHERNIKSIYRKFRVRIPPLPRINLKNAKNNKPIEYTDYLTKDEIKLAMEYMNIHAKARTLAMASSGLSNEECTTLTTRQFIDDLYNYHKCDDDIEALKYLANPNNNHIWVTKLVRVKTGKPYYAVFNPETIQCIAQSKLKEPEINPVLLTNSKKHYWKILTNINKNLNMGKAGGHYRLRPHMLRKFHATAISSSNLNYGEESMLRNFEIDELQGRGKTNVQDTYIKTNPLRQKLLYAKVMNNVSFYHEYEYYFNCEDVEVWVKDHKKEYEKLKTDYDKIKSNQTISDELRNHINNVGVDNFRDELHNLINEL